MKMSSGASRRGLLKGLALSAGFNQGEGFLLYAIAASIIGGVSVFGGRDHVPGILGGVLLLTVIHVGLSIVDVPSFYVDMIGGVAIFVAVAIDALRVFDPAHGGPSVVRLRGDALVDVTASFPTVSGLLDADDPAAVLSSAPAGRAYALADIMDASLQRDDTRPHLLAPADLQAIKACGVTLARSIIERVIEERAGGGFARAAAMRERIGRVVAGRLSELRPGSPEAEAAKRALQAEGLWSQYLEVGIGPNGEVFTKAAVLSSVGFGAEIGVLRASVWNPEPEVVLAVDGRGRTRGATLGNDVNLRDIEGRSALLLGKAKDNAFCAIGPFIRLFDDGFTMDDVRGLELALTVTGQSDGYMLRGASPMREISRDPEPLVGRAIGANHHDPDGMMPFLGTLFAPTEDRDVPGQGFTLGRLVNPVTYADAAPPWRFGMRAPMRSLAARGLLGAG